jgi:hypothetical protein
MEIQDDRKLTLTFEDASCTEVWLTIKMENIPLPAAITIKQNDQTRSTINLATADTLLYIDSLLPNRTYSFKAELSGISSNKVTATTLDTTSHNFTWQTWTFGGEAGSSTLYDVSIINENDIWAVGEIYLLDSLGQPDPLAYNAVHWDGSKWEVERIQTYFRGNLITVPLEGIFAFTAKDIWMVGSLPIHGDGTNWQMYDIRTTVDPSLSLSKAWGTNTNDMYFVGRSGSIAHYQNGGWNKIESGTNLNINDIWGDYNEKTKEYEIIAVASNILESFEKEIIKISGTNTEIINKDGIPGTLGTIWFNTERKYLLGGSGIMEKTNLNENIWKNGQFDITSFYIYRIRGENFNNISATGGVGEVLHFNGFSWQSYIEKTRLNFGNYYSISIKNNTIVAVGENSPGAVITVGRR